MFDYFYKVHPWTGTKEETWETRWVRNSEDILQVTLEGRQICLQAVCKEEILLSLGQVFGMVFELSTPKFGQNEDFVLAL